MIGEYPVCRKQPTSPKYDPSTKDLIRSPVSDMTAARPLTMKNMMSALSPRLVIFSPWEEGGGVVSGRNQKTGAGVDGSDCGLSKQRQGVSSRHSGEVTA